MPSTRNRAAAARVVLADSDQSLHVAYRGQLVKEHVELIPAFSGIDCVHRLREDATDALVIDADLPWGGGEGVLAVMSGTPQWADIPVLVHTAVRDIQSLNWLLHYPIQDFQIKPLAPEDLAVQVRRLLDPTRRRDALTARNLRLERMIALQTGNRLRKLRVEATAGQVVVHGVSRSPEIGPLVLAVVTDSLRRTESPLANVKLRIKVATASDDDSLTEERYIE